MSNQRSIKNSFLGGQISPTVWGRTDLPTYPHSCRLLLNAIPRLSGGVYRRPGTLNIDNMPLGSTGAGGNTVPRLFPFIVSRSEPYCIAINSDPGAGHANAVSYRLAGAPRTGSYTKSTVTGNLPYQYAMSGNGLTDDEIFQIKYFQANDILYLSHPKYKPYTIKRTAKDTFAATAFDNGLSGQALVSAYPYLNQNVTGITITPSATTGSSITLTASSGIFNSLHVGAIFVINQAGAVGAAQITAFTDTTHVTAKVHVQFGATTGSALWWESAWSDYRGWPACVSIYEQRLIYASNSFQPDKLWNSETANFNVFSLLAATVPGTYDTQGNFTAGSGQYLAPVDDSEGNGQTTGPTGAQPFSQALTQNTEDTIQWLSPDKELLIGTQSQEWVTAPQSNDFSVGGYATVLQSKYGSDNVQAVRIGYELMFSLGTGDEVRAYQYNYIDASFFGEPVQLLFDQYPIAENSTTPTGLVGVEGRRKLRQMDWDVTRNTLWCMDTAGNFYGMTRDRKLQVTAWHTHQFGGYDATKGKKCIDSSTARTVDPAYAINDGQVASFAVIPNPVTQLNDVWLVVKRTNTADVNWQLEIMSGKDTPRTTAYQGIYPGLSSTEPFLVDACVAGSDFGDPTDLQMPANVTYLNGQTGLVGTYYSLANGIFKITAGAVAAGAALLNKPLPVDFGTVSNYFVMGLPFTPTIQPVPVEAGSVIGTSQAALQRLNRAHIRVFKTLAAMVGTIGQEQEGNSERVHFWQASTPMGKSPELFTGYKEVLVPSAYDKDATLNITCPDPVPFALTSVVVEGVEID